MPYENYKLLQKAVRTSERHAKMNRKAQRIQRWENRFGCLLLGAWAASFILAALKAYPPLYVSEINVAAIGMVVASSFTTICIIYAYGVLVGNRSEKIERQIVLEYKEDSQKKAREAAQRRQAFKEEEEAREKRTADLIAENKRKALLIPKYKSFKPTIKPPPPTPDPCNCQDYRQGKDRWWGSLPTETVPLRR